LASEFEFAIALGEDVEVAPGKPIGRGNIADGRIPGELDRYRSSRSICGPLQGAIARPIRRPATVAHRRMGQQDPLDFDRRNVRTTANNGVFLAGDEPESAKLPPTICMGSFDSSPGRKAA
jgi:hypothetical protein